MCFSYEIIVIFFEIQGYEGMDLAATIVLIAAKGLCRILPALHGLSVKVRGFGKVSWNRGKVVNHLSCLQSGRICQ